MARAHSKREAKYLLTISDQRKTRFMSHAITGASAASGVSGACAASAGASSEPATSLLDHANAMIAKKHEIKEMAKKLKSERSRRSNMVRKFRLQRELRQQEEDFRAQGAARHEDEPRVAQQSKAALQATKRKNKQRVSSPCRICRRPYNDP